MVDTVVLHVGPHKTGTTALQKALRGNEALLARHGILYPQTGRRFDSHAPLGEALALGDHALLPALADETTGWRVVLISTEHLSSLDVPALTLLREVFPGAEFRVSYTLRRLPALWPSHWAELVKHGQRLSFAGYLERVARRDDRPFHAPILPGDQLDRLVRVFGPAALRIGCYDARLAEGQDFGPLFIDDMLGLGHLAPAFATQRHNLSPRPLETALVYLMNQFAAGALDYPVKMQLRLDLLAALRRDPPPDWLSGLTAALETVERLELAETHPLLRAETEAVLQRHGHALQDPVESFLAPLVASVPRLETLRLPPEDQAALQRELTELLAAQGQADGA